MNLSSPIATSSSSASSPIACKSLGMPIASVKPDSRMGNSNLFDAASTSQVRLQDAYLGGSMEKQRGNPSHQEEEDSEDSDNPEIWYYNKLRREPLPKTVKLGGNPLHTEPVLQLIRKVKKDTDATWRHYFQISPHTSQYTEAVLSMIRRIYGRQPGDPVKGWDVNLAIWGQFKNATLQAAVFLGQDYDANLRYVKHTRWETAGQLFRETEKLVRGQTETSGISTIDFQDSRWMSTSLLHSRAYQYSTAKAYVFSDSVLCLGKMGDDPIESWKSKIQWNSENNYFRELNRIDGQPMEFEWKIFPGLTSMGILKEIQLMMRELQCEPENFTGRIIFMSMFNDIVWDQKGNNEICENNSKTIQKYARRFPRGHLSFLGSGSEKKWYGTYDHKPDGSWDRTAEKMLLNFAETKHPIFRGTSALERVDLRSKGGGEKSIHFNGSTQNIELLLQMVISVNQLSIYGAVAGMIEELPVGQKAPVNTAAPGQLDKEEILTQPPSAEVQANEERQGNLLQEYEQRFETLSEDHKLSKLCSEAGFRSVEIGQFFYTLPSPRAERNQSLCREKTMPRDQEGTRIKGWIQSNVQFGPISDVKVCNHSGRYSIEV